VALSTNRVPDGDVGGTDGRTKPMEQRTVDFIIVGPA
jgi:hypothetical protein